jgi:hypothetical protein
LPSRPRAPSLRRPRALRCLAFLALRRDPICPRDRSRP